MPGYTQTELDDVQAKWQLHFPSDLVDILRDRRGVIDDGEKLKSFDWINETDEVIRECLEWPFESFLFDAQHGLWWPEWGERPVDSTAVKEQLQTIFASAPKLIPVYSHRYIPEEPGEAGNPIFSVYQMDVIIYGANLADFIERELDAPIDGSCPQPDWPTVKRIPFWTRAVEFNIDRFSSGDGFAFFNKNLVLPEN